MFDNFFDVLIISIIVITTLFGFYLGLIATLIFYVAIIFSRGILNKVLPEILPAMDFLFANPLIQLLILLIIVFIFVKICQSFTFKFPIFSLLDKILGGILGFLGGCILLTFLLQSTKNISYFQDEIVNSAFIPYVLQLGQYFLF